MSPYASVALPPLVSRQAYDVSLHLQVPTSQSNLELGNFMTSLTITTTNNRTVATVRRPVSSQCSFIVTDTNTCEQALVLPASQSPLSFLWTTPGMTEISISMLNRLEVGSTSAAAYVEIGRRDHWKTIRTGEGREVSVASAMLRGVVVHKGLR